MMVLEGFWAGAVQHGRTFDVAVLAERAGGYDVLEGCGERDLVRLGVSAEAARSWVRAEPVHTRWRALRLCDAGYPPQLLRLSAPGVPERGCAPPAVLFVEGDPAVLCRPAVAIVGTRACTPYGVGLARRTARVVARTGKVVVSGLARGIDGHSHRAACEVGVSVAVVAHGLDHTSPSSHRGLRVALVAGGGTVISTWPDAVVGAPFRFPLRNRWIAALATDVVVVEAPVRSGALITAEFGARIGRRVWAMPGPLGTESSAGCLALAEHGQARLVTSLDSLGRALGGGELPRPERWLTQVFAGADLSAVARDRGVSYVELLSELARLEVEGRVVRLPGRRYAPAGVHR